MIQPLGRSANKTDRRDANALSELLWVNRERLQRGDRVQGVRTVLLPSVEQQADRHLTQLRQRLVLRRTQTLNQIHKILRRHNLEWERPTKSLQTRLVAEWLKTLPLGAMDRLTVDQLLVQWRLWEEQLVAADARIAERFRANPDAQRLGDPHIGTNKLPGIVQAIRETIMNCGGEVRFETRMTDIITDNDRVKGILAEAARKLPRGVFVDVRGQM